MEFLGHPMEKYIASRVKLLEHLEQNHHGADRKNAGNRRRNKFHSYQML